MDERNGQSTDRGHSASKVAWANALIRQFLLDFLRTAPFQFGSLIVLILLSSPQGGELTVISEESDLQWNDRCVVAIIPALYALATAAAVGIGRWALPAIGIPRTNSLQNVISLCMVCLPMPLILAVKLHFHLAYAGYIISALAILIATRLVMRNVDLRLWVTSMILVYGLFMFKVATDARFDEYVGTIGVVVIGMSIWAFLLTAALILVFGLALRSPILLIAFVLVAVSAVALLSRPTTVEVNADDDEMPMDSDLGLYGSYPHHSAVQAYFLDWIAKRANEFPQDSSIPVYLVAAEGGGLRAAAWTMSVLRELDALSGSDFSRQTFAVSGVSGGAVGLGYYFECKTRTPSWPDECGPKEAERDFLASAVARLLLMEPLRVIPVIGTKIDSRGRAFERQLESAGGDRGRDRLSQPMNKVFDTGASGTTPPIVIFNSTDVDTGQRVYFSNLDLQASNSVHGNGLYPDAGGVPLSFAMHTSARFPGISSPATYGHLTLVDGGYRENTGIPELRLVLRSIENILEFAVQEEDALPVIYVPRQFGLDRKPYVAEAESLMKHYRRARALRSVLKRVQVHVVAVTDHDYADKPLSGIKNKTPIGDASSIEEELMSPLGAILSSRTNRSGEAVRSLVSDLEEPSGEQKRACDKERRDAAERQGKRGRPDYLLAYELHYEAESIPCESEVSRHAASLIPLNKYIEQQYPGLGWVLSRRSHELISDAAASAVSELPDVIQHDGGRTAWYEELIGNLCGGAGTGDIVGTLSFDKAGTPICQGQ